MIWFIPKTLQQKRRFKLVLAALTSVILGVCILLYSFEQFVVYYYTPSEIITQDLQLNNKVYRLGGVVEVGSVTLKQNHIEFFLTDGKVKVKVQFTGILPSLFREGSGAIAEGYFVNKSLFIANLMLAKHDETYRPPSANQ